MKVMPHPRPPYLHREITRHGKAVWYVRIGKGRRVRLRGEFGTPDFGAEYQAAVTGAPRSRVKGAPAVGSLAWLIARYRETTVWSALAVATRRTSAAAAVHFHPVTRNGHRWPHSHRAFEGGPAGGRRRTAGCGLDPRLLGRGGLLGGPIDPTLPVTVGQAALTARRRAGCRQRAS